MVVGGTPLYLQWFVHGPPDAPPSSPETALAVAGLLMPLELKRRERLRGLPIRKHAAVASETGKAAELELESTPLAHELQHGAPCLQQRALCRWWLLRKLGELEAVEPS